MSCELQRHIEFNIDPFDTLIAANTRSGATEHTLGPAPTSSSRKTAARAAYDETDAKVANTHEYEAPDTMLGMQRWLLVQVQVKQHK